MSNIKETLESLLEARRESIHNMYVKNLTARRKRVMEMLEAPLKKAFAEITYDEEPCKYTKKRYYNTRYTHSFGETADTREEVEAKILNYFLTSAYAVQKFNKKNPDIDMPGYIDHAGLLGDMLTDARMQVNSNTYDRGFASDEFIDMKAAQLTEHSMAMFVEKMTSKLAAIGTVVESRIDTQWGDLYQTCLNLKFDNGISCNLINSIVGKVSSKGNYFVQFPARFNNVQLNGESQKNCASEAAIKRLAKTIKETV